VQAFNKEHALGRDGSKPRNFFERFKEAWPGLEEFQESYPYEYAIFKEYAEGISWENMPRDDLRQFEQAYKGFAPYAVRRAGLDLNEVGLIETILSLTSLAAGAHRVMEVLHLTAEGSALNSHIGVITETPTIFGNQNPQYINRAKYLEKMGYDYVYKD
jgi:hypothetical protein